MYLEKIKELEEWKNSKDRMPLIIRGARQVGKTWIMKEFGKNNYKKVAYINFDGNTRMVRLFEGDFDIDRIIQGLKIETQVDIDAENTLLIFDEIQEVPKALTSLKYFCENARQYHILAAGSLLGVALHEDHSDSRTLCRRGRFSLGPRGCFRQIQGRVGGSVGALHARTVCF